MSAVIAEAAVTGPDGRVYAARMLSAVVGVYGGATNLTRYMRRDGREWRPVSWSSVPRRAYAQLRARLVESKALLKGRVRS